jgi:hypothetical protein
MPDVLPGLVRFPEVAGVVEVASKEVVLVLSPLFMRAPSARRALGLRIGVTPGVSSGVRISARQEGVSREGLLR